MSHGPVRAVLLDYLEKVSSGTFSGPDPMQGAGESLVREAGLRPFVRGAYKQTIKPERITRRDKGKDGDMGTYSDGLPTQILKPGGLGKPLFYFFG